MLAAGSTAVSNISLCSCVLQGKAWQGKGTVMLDFAQERPCQEIFFSPALLSSQHGVQSAHGWEADQGCEIWRESV